MPIPKVILKAKRAQPFFGRHPWVFAGATERVEGAPADGDEVELHVKMAPLPGTQVWRVRITELVEPTLVVDELIKGPFAQFRHEHRFARNAAVAAIIAG